MSNKKEYLMSRPSVVLLAIVMATGLSGCITDDDPTANTFVPYSIDDRYPLGVAKGPITMDVDASKGMLGPRQARAVANLARQAASTSVTPVTVSGSGAVANQVVDVLSQNGVPRNMIKVAAHRGSAVRISYIAAQSTSRECGTWDKDFTETGSNQPHPNHGCAVRSNIAAMVANPEDLVVSKGSTPNPAGTDVTAVGRVENNGLF